MSKKKTQSTRTRSDAELAAIDKTNIEFYCILREAGFDHTFANLATVKAMADNCGPDVKDELSSWIKDGRPGALVPHPYDKNPELAKADGFNDEGSGI